MVSGGTNKSLWLLFFYLWYKFGSNDYTGQVISFLQLAQGCSKSSSPKLCLLQKLCVDIWFCLTQPPNLMLITISWGFSLVKSASFLFHTSLASELLWLHLWSWQRETMADITFNRVLFLSEKTHKQPS